jgi:hypothetical protein
MSLPSLSSFFENLPAGSESWDIAYYVTAEVRVNKMITINDKISLLEESLQFPLGYHQALLDYHANFEAGFADFLKENHGQDKAPVSFMHPIDKVRTTKENLDYIGFFGPVGIYYLPADESLRGKVRLLLDKDHPITLHAPDKYVYVYYGCAGIENKAFRI